MPRNKKKNSEKVVMNDPPAESTKPTESAPPAPEPVAPPAPEPVAPPAPEPVTPQAPAPVAPPAPEPVVDPLQKLFNDIEAPTTMRFGKSYSMNTPEGLVRYVWQNNRYVRA